MKTIPLFLACFACVLAACSPSQNEAQPEGSQSPAADPFAPNPPPGMRLVWGDEFDVDGRPNPANWTYETGYVRNHEAQWYRPENAEVRDGCLVITAQHHETPLQNPNPSPFGFMFGGNDAPIEYTSACLITNGLHSF